MDTSFRSELTQNEELRLESKSYSMKEKVRGVEYRANIVRKLKVNTTSSGVGLYPDVTLNTNSSTTNFNVDQTNYKIRDQK